MGCGYCAWACPYGVPQYDDEQGIMTKCDLCCDSLDEGLPPNCVAACPMRVLDYAMTEHLESSKSSDMATPATEHLPITGLLAHRTHLASDHTQEWITRMKKWLNREETCRHSHSKITEEGFLHRVTLVAFTLLRKPQ
jgi:Fe-S-cluster-containing dehydrogenase component